MKRTHALILCTLSVTFFAIARAQTTQSAPAEGLEQTAKRLGLTADQYKKQISKSAKEMGVTPEEFDRFLHREMGDPLVVDDDLYVGFTRDATGRVVTVKIATPNRSVEFNRQPDENHRGLNYVGGEVAPNAAFASASDLDGDARIDMIMLRHTREEEEPIIVLRIGDKFEPAQALGDHKFQLVSDHRLMAFDLTSHEWIEHGK